MEVQGHCWIQSPAIQRQQLQKFFANRILWISGVHGGARSTTSTICFRSIFEDLNDLAPDFRWSELHGFDNTAEEPRVPRQARNFWRNLGGIKIFTTDSFEEILEKDKKADVTKPFRWFLVSRPSKDPLWIRRNQPLNVERFERLEGLISTPPPTGWVFTASSPETPLSPHCTLRALRSSRSLRAGRSVRSLQRGGQRNSTELVHCDKHGPSRVIATHIP